MNDIFNKYSFLFKPAFFIFCLVAGSWIVLKIEKLSPSDFGKHRSLFEKEKTVNIENRKPGLRKLVHDYKNGIVDSIMFEMRLDEFLKQYEDPVIAGNEDR